MYILRSMFVISGCSLYPGFIIARFNCLYVHVTQAYICTCMSIYVKVQRTKLGGSMSTPRGGEGVTFPCSPGQGSCQSPAGQNPFMPR